MKARLLVPVLLAVAFLLSACEEGDVSGVLAVDMALDDLGYALDRANFLSASLQEEEIARITYNEPPGFWYDNLFRDTTAYHVRGFEVTLDEDGTSGVARVEFGRTARSGHKTHPSWLVVEFGVQQIDGAWLADLTDLVAGLTVRED